MKHYRFSFQWFTPDGIPTICWEFSTYSYNRLRATQMALQKIIDSGIPEVGQQLKTKECVMTIMEAGNESN